MDRLTRIGIPSALIALAGLLYAFWPSSSYTPTASPQATEQDNTTPAGTLAAEAPLAGMATPATPSSPRSERSAQAVTMTSDPPPPLPPLMRHQPTPPDSISPPSLTIAHAELLAHATEFSDVAEAAERFGQHQREAADPGFAPMTEVGLIEYLVRHLPPGEFSVQKVSCRTQGCFIQVYGYAENSADRWQATLSELEQAPMTDQLGAQQTISGQWTEGQSALLTFLPRRNS